MNKYETIFIINTSADEAKKKELVEKFSALINSNGKVESVDEWGLKKLAYPVQKQKEGYYVLVNFEAKPELIAELERVYRITDDIMKFITVKKENK